MKLVAQIAGAFVLLAGLVGCEAQAPAFAGKWVEQSGATPSAHTLTIHQDRGVYLVTETIPIGGMVKTVNDVAKVESASVLSVKNGFRALTLKDGVLHYMTRSYVKAPD